MTLKYQLFSSSQRQQQPPRRWKKPSYATKALWRPRETKFVGRPTNRERSTKSKFVGFDDEDDISVEMLALQFFAQAENGSWTGVHSENGIWSTLFALLFWVRSES